MKILLVNPPLPAMWYNNDYYVPSGLLYLGAVLQKNGDEAKLLNFQTLPPATEDTLEQHRRLCEGLLVNAIKDFCPDLIGFGCLYSGNFPEVLRFSILCKKEFKDIPIIAGGIHFTIYAREILLNCPSFDWIALGEAEDLIVQLVNIIKEGRGDLGKLDGFAYRKDGNIIVNPKRYYIKDIDTIPFPAYNLIDFKDYFRADTVIWHNPKGLPIEVSAPIISSRSCPNRCNFCSMYMAMGPQWRGRSAQNVVDEVELLYRKYNRRHFSFMDDNFTLNKQRAIQICNLISERNLNIQFETPNGLNLRTLDKEVIDALVRAGLVRIPLAIESGSDFIRNKIMRKNISREKILEIVRFVKGYKNLRIDAFFIIGMPEETHRTLEETYGMIRDIDADRTHVHHIMPYGATRVFEQALRDNLFVGVSPENFYKSPDLHFNKNIKFFIKPYELDLKDLEEFKERCSRLIKDQMARRTKEPVNI